MQFKIKKRIYKSNELFIEIFFALTACGLAARKHVPTLHFAEKQPLLIGVAKGVTRKPGLETLIIGESHDEIHLPNDSPALHLIQQIRDEAHRFAITGHRHRRAVAKKTSVLEGIAGVGPKRRQALLKYMGGLQELKRAGVEELAKVPGISRDLAEKIYHALHP